MGSMIGADTERKDTTRLPIGLKIVERNGSGAIVSTESGHRFLIHAAVADSVAEDAFTLEALESRGGRPDVSDHAMARALINEMIGAPKTAAGSDAETQRKNG